MIKMANFMLCNFFFYHIFLSEKENSGKEGLKAEQACPVGFGT